MPSARILPSRPMVAVECNMMTSLPHPTATSRPTPGPLRMRDVPSRPARDAENREGSGEASDPATRGADVARVTEKDAASGFATPPGSLTPGVASADEDHAPPSPCGAR